MIPVVQKPEPSNFNSDIRQKGLNFLNVIPRPRGKQWHKKEYWRLCIPDLKREYNRICAYSAVKIPAHTGEPTVDHFISRDSNPSLAYEWSNFRLACKRFNTRKNKYTIVDPFAVQHGWFVMNFRTYMIEPSNIPGLLNSQQYDLIKFTIEKLRLNDDDDLIYERYDFIKDYATGVCKYSHLQKYAPFIAYELQRQDLLQTIMTWNI